MDIVVADIGGTHARFALAEVNAGGIALGPETVLKTSEYAGIAEAWAAFAATAGSALPRAAGIAVAGPVHGETVRMTNSSWVLRPAELPQLLGLDRLVFLNDFAAVAHAVPACAAGEILHIAGPDVPLPDEGVVTVIGPGTGLGVAILLRRRDGNVVISTEGGHAGFAPHDELEEAITRRVREFHGRASVERIVSGAGLAEIHAVLTGEEADDRSLWGRALSGADQAAVASLDRFCAILGSATGDLALAHGADAIVLAGGLGQRLANRLPHSAFANRLCDKGRFSNRMAQLPVKLITHPQPGLLGAAAAVQAQYAG